MLKKVTSYNIATLVNNTYIKSYRLDTVLNTFRILCVCIRCVRAGPDIHHNLERNNLTLKRTKNTPKKKKTLVGLLSYVHMMGKYMVNF